MVSKVAVVDLGQDAVGSFKHALELIGKIDDLNTAERPVTIKVGVFDPEAQNHTTVNVVNALIKGFDKTPKIYLAESDNYRGTGLERLQLWKELFSERIVPFNLSTDTNTRKVKIADEEMNFSHILFKPNVLVSTHVLRSFEKGSILKNLFGLVPDPKKARFHKNLVTVLLDAYEAVGGIDLAVLDGTYRYKEAGNMPHAKRDDTMNRWKPNIILVGRDAIAVETVGATLVGLEPEKMPIIQEAVNRGLGEGNIDKIETLGLSLETLKERLASPSTVTKRMSVKKK